MSKVQTMPLEIWTDINGNAARTQFKGGTKYIRADAQAAVEALQREVNTLNQLLRDKGLGQGEIDGMAADVDELTQLQALVRALSKDFHLEDMRKAEAEAQKWEAEGDMYGWNFHQGRASGIREEQSIVYRIMRENGIDPLKATLDATTPAPMGSNIREEDIGKSMMRSKGDDGE